MSSDERHVCVFDMGQMFVVVKEKRNKRKKNQFGVVISTYLRGCRVHLILCQTDLDSLSPHVTRLIAIRLFAR